MTLPPYPSLYWRHDQAPHLQQGCTGVVRFRRIRLFGRLLVPAELVDATVVLTIKADRYVPDSAGQAYMATPAADVDDPGTSTATITVPAVDLDTAGEKWGNAVLQNDGGRYALGYGPIFIDDL